MSFKSKKVHTFQSVSDPCLFYIRPAKSTSDSEEEDDMEIDEGSTTEEQYCYICIHVDDMAIGVSDESFFSKVMTSHR